MAATRGQYQTIIDRLVAHFYTLIEPDQLILHMNDGETDLKNDPNNYNYMLVHNIPELLESLRYIKDANHYNFVDMWGLFEKMRRGAP
jgi:hypothetical protein